ncbi:dol-P-Man:Man(5)GlcNAc(2)-PP-Dol alpha-1,3-mannosyltransferase-like isoform X1 [Sycon ciliatum]|uniref:dol-P-Man:Man(5)GlcNAc(2)-PP-Dol alpha-1,3-mannosyltransferase-like isoform X1 n=1 Tax=Sycon ciliatum TaxID=27933 RepID=UPI0031F70D44
MASIINFVADVATNRSWTTPICVALLLFEAVLNVAVIWKVPYTEIDWEAYMQEVEGVVNGSYNYSTLEGGTGPLVYPAGFVYVFLAFYYVTSYGANIRLAQYIFAGLYMLNLGLVFKLYHATKKVPPFVLAAMCLVAYRIHSIFVLRLFNDPLAMILLYLAVNLFVSGRWTTGCAVFSLAVSVKMNILLFAPGLGILLLQSLGPVRTFVNIAMCAVIQVALGAPFLLVDPMAYMSRSFNLGRQFFFKWTVNWRFLAEETFLDRRFHAALLALHLLLLISFALFRWTRSQGGVAALFRTVYPLKKLSADHIITVLFASNLIGMACARSLHYQFYVWYYHTIPYLLWSTSLPTVIRLALLLGIEVAWNVYPSTNWSSALLHVCHAMLLAALWISKSPAPAAATPKQD